MENIHILQPLEWDSTFFGKKIAKVDLAEVKESTTELNDMIKESPFDLVYCFAPQSMGTADELANRIDGAVWVDGKLTYCKKVHKQIDEQFLYIQSAHEMEEKLFDLAIQTGVYSRFHTDKSFEKGLYINLYKKWIENSVNKSIAKEVAVWRENGQIEGMITIGEKNGRADIGLVGVDTEARGKGIATMLLKYAEAFAVRNGYRKLQVVTQQQNEPACKLYEKNGFEVESLINIFHIWK